MEIATLAAPEDFPETILRYTRCAAEDVGEGETKRVLSMAEQGRYQRIKSAPARRRFAAGRFSLRISLAELLGLAPSEISLTQTSTGKPKCEQGWEFSLSHAGDWVLLALHPHLPVGIDLEAPRVLGSPKRLLAKLGFAHLLDSETPSGGEGRFDLNQEALKRWNRNEALMKAIGYGMSQANKLRRMGNGSYQWEQYQIQSRQLYFQPAPDYLATLAIVT